MASELVTSIREKQLRLSVLKREVRELEDELRDIKAAVTGNTGAGRRQTRETTKVRARSIKAKSAIGYAYAVLAQNEKPLHVDSILAYISRLYGVTVLKTTLVSGLSRYVNAGDTFTREREGVYGLVEFAKEKIAG
jgi:hypothetical protein